MGMCISSREVGSLGGAQNLPSNHLRETARKFQYIDPSMVMLAVMRFDVLVWGNRFEYLYIGTSRLRPRWYRKNEVVCVY